MIGICIVLKHLNMFAVLNELDISCLFDLLTLEEELTVVVEIIRRQTLIRATQMKISIPGVLEQPM